MTDAADFWAATVQAYAPLQLQSPEFTEKLLRRPPFRFIHDIVAAINARFAAYDGVIPADYKDAAAVDTKEKKLEYLQILIDYVGKLLNTTVDVNPKKIVSGHEPEKTNVFLQYLAMAVGCAQQDKARAQPPKSSAPAEKKHRKSKSKNSSETAAAAASAAPTPPPPPPPPVLDGENGGHSSASVAAGATFATRSNLPNHDSLPRKRSSAVSSGEKAAANQRAVDEALAFNKKLTGFSIDLSSDSAAFDVKKANASIVRMWQELQQSQVETEQSTMPEDSLEKAIKRQLDALRQVQTLLAENDVIIKGLENRII